MKKQILVLALLLPALLIGGEIQAQKYLTKNGSISFFSSTSFEDIEAHNKQVNAALNMEDGSVAFKVLIKSFKFEKALMQKHFNENYMESDKYPNAEFKGTIQKFDATKYSEDGTYDVTVKGKLTLHGVTKEITVDGKIKKSGDSITITCDFSVKLEDYKIKKHQKVAEVIDITIDTTLKKK